MERIEKLSNQVAINHCSSNPLQKSDDDVVICSAVRTPLTKSKRGLLKDTTPDILVSTCLKAILDRSKVDPKAVQDIIIGNNLQIGSGEIPHRMALFLAGFPDTTCIVSINRLCSSGLEACAMIAAKIKAGQIDLGIGGGIEQMSLFDMQKSVDPEKIADSVFDHDQANKCLMPMGITSENVAEQYGVSREKQDQLAVESHQKAFAAREKGLFKDEIVAVKTQVKDDKGNEKEVTVTEDDGIRKETTFEGLSKLKPAFKKEGSTTAGNSSQVMDGAAAVLLARRSVAKKLGLPILAQFVSYTVAGCPPQLMGIGPAVAIPQVLQKTGLSVKDIGVFEINQAFASQAYYSVEKLGIPWEKVNPKGGAIALGHPLGATGARQIATLLPELKRTKTKYGLTSMCIGTGMGAAAIFENEQN